MKVCVKCNKETIDGNFCGYCGGKLQYENNVQSNQYGVLVVNRKNMFLASLVSFNIIVDGMICGKVKSGKSIQIPLFYGQHYVEIKQGLNKSAGTPILISEQARVITLDVSIQMGILTNEIVINNMSASK